MNNRIRYLTYLAFGLVFAAAFADTRAETAEAEKPAGTLPERNIQVVVENANLERFDSAIAADELANGVAANLSAAHFPIRKKNKTFTHTLVANLSPVKHKSTPVGFSFSAGNSDPRAPEFQKADVLTVNCSLTNNQRPGDVVTQASEFSVDPHEFSGHSRADTTKRRLIECISTACFGLLEDLHLADTDSSAEGLRPRWMPQIRIEVQNETSSPGAAGKTASTPGKKHLDEEPHKKLIIHNQGSPVILKLGHERL